MKKALMIAYIFPPSGGSGVQRTLKFVKYLSCYGWQPVVLTVKNPDSKCFDPTLLKDVPDGTVVRQAGSLNLLQYYRCIKGKKKFLSESANKNTERNNVIKRIFKIIERFMSGVANNFLFIPDEYIGWFPAALWHGYRLIRKEQISLIYASGNPWTAFVIAKCLSAVAKIPYVIDFRDPWVLSAFIAKTERRTFKHYISRKIEYSCIKNANRVINVNENITNIFKRYYKKFDSTRFITITHGFDEEDFEKTIVKNNNRFVISHIGTLHANRNPDGLFEALNHIFKLHSHLITKIEIRLVGIINPVAEKSIINNNLTDVVKIIPYCPHKKSIEEMCSANLLFLIQGNTQGKNAETSPGKVFEYLASGTKILALVSRKNDAVKIIEGLNAGIAVEPDNVNIIAETILGYYKKWELGEAAREVGRDVSIYSRRHLAGVLAKSFDDICKYQ